jgi:hypothetical protein
MQLDFAKSQQQSGRTDFEGAHPVTLSDVPLLEINGKSCQWAQAGALNMLDFKVRPKRNDQVSRNGNTSATTQGGMKIMN